MKQILLILAVLICVMPSYADLIKQSTAYTRMVYMSDSTTSRAPGVAGLTLTITASKAGGAFAAITPTVTDLTGGWYSLAYTSTHTNTLGAFALKITATGADETDTLDQIVAFDPTDASLLGLTGVSTLAQQNTLTNALVPYISTVNDAFSTTTVIDTALTGTADLTGNRVVFTTGALKGVYRTISAMNTTTGAITLLSALSAAPANGVGFSIVQGSKALEQFLSALGTDNKVILSNIAGAQAGVTIPTVTTLTNAVTANVTQIAGQTANAATAVTFPTSIGTSTFTVGQNVGAATSVTAGVTVTTNNDKTGYSLTTAPPTTAQIQAYIDANSTQFAALVTGQATITAKTNLIATNAGDSANQIATQSAFTTFNTLFGTRIPGVIQPQTGDSYARLGAAIVLPTTPPTGYALPGYYYAPVLDSGSAGVTSLVVTVTNPTNSTTSRLINWTVDSLATSYKVMRSTDGINYTKIATIAAGTLSYTDASRPAGTVYYSVISVH